MADWQTCGEGEREGIRARRWIVVAKWSRAEVSNPADPVTHRRGLIGGWRIAPHLGSSPSRAVIGRDPCPPVARHGWTWLASHGISSFPCILGGGADVLDGTGE